MDWTHPPDGVGAIGTERRVVALDRIRLRYFPLWAIGILFGCILVVQPLPVSFETSPALLGSLSLALIVVSWIGWTARRHQLSFRALFGSVPRNASAWGSIGIAVVGMNLIQTAESVLLIPWLEQNGPWLKEWYRINAVGTLPSDPWAYVSRVAPAVVVAPIIEETFFRGLVYQRWARAWNRPSLALLGGAVAFALVHGNWGGAFVFALVATFLYVQTRSLWAPVVFHALVNGTAAFGGIPIQKSLALVGVRSTEAVGVACLVFAALWVGWLVKEYFSHRHAPLPYVENLTSSRLETSRRSSDQEPP